MKKQNENPAKAGLRALGNRVTSFEKLETFPVPPGVHDVTCVSDEVTALCPVTGQPDWYKVTINYEPRMLCAESKTVKLFLQRYRNQGHFCEAFASIIAHEFSVALKARRVTVSVEQKPRGGVSIIATATFHNTPEA